jgi:hypothetical protein
MWRLKPIVGMSNIPSFDNWISNGNTDINKESQKPA